MAKKFQKLGNYFVVTDTTLSKVLMERPTKDIYYKDNNDTIVFNDIIHDNIIGEITGYPFGFANATGSVTINSVSPTKASGTITCASVVGRDYASGSVTFASAVANAFATNTAQCTSVIAGNTVTVNGLLYTAVSGAKADNTEFSVDTGDTECAADLADSINNDTRTGTLGDVSASPSTDTVTLTTDVEGAAGNAVTLAETGGTITLGGPTFSGGVDADTIEVNGLTYTAVAGVKADNTEFSIDTSNDSAAADFEDSVNNDVRPGTLNDITASATTDTVTLTQTVGGAGGNATTLSSSDGTRLAVSGAVFTGGADGDTVTINGLVYTAVVGAKADDTEFSVDTSDDACATDLADSIDDDVRVGTLNDLTATATTNTVTAVQTVGGTGGNATTLVSSDGTRLAVSGAVFSGGLDDAEVTMITVDAVNIMSGAETAGEDASVLASQVAANITAHTSTPNYTATANGAVITITADTADTAVNGLVVATTVVKATKTDVNMAGAGADIIDSTDTSFASKAALLTFLRANTGA